MAASHSKNGKVRVIIYGRHSKEDGQNQKSSKDQEALCRERLEEMDLDEASIEAVLDEGVSGELVSRPGIDRVREMIEAGQCDVVVAEDSSRLYRNAAALLSLVGSALDNDVRLIAFNDALDTADPRSDYMIKVMFSGLHHERYNDDVSERIKRAAKARWDAGYVMGPLVPGYTGVLVDSEEQNRKSRGPLRAEKDERWAPVIGELFERVARGDPFWSVANFLNASKFPRPHNAREKNWDERGAKTLVRNPLYMGVERFRKTQNKKHYGTGRHLAERSDPKDILTREMPHLAFVSAELWQQANRAIDSRDRSGNHPKGKANATFRVPRDSRGPLGGHFLCGVCGGKMIGQGRNGGGYRCGNALRGKCWNRATVKRDLVHSRLSQAITKPLLSLDGAADSLVKLVHRLSADAGDFEHTARKLEGRIQRLGTEIERYAEAVGQAEDVGILLEKLRERERERADAQLELQILGSRKETTANPPSRREILQTAEDLSGQFLDMDREAGVLVKQITTPIVAVPFQRIDCDLVVLRARFQLRLTALLPQEWQQLLRGVDMTPAEAGVWTDEITVDLFEHPGPIKFAKQALALSRQTPKLTGEEIAKKLGTTRRSAYDAIKLGERMEQDGLDEPYVELSECPENASRWRQRSRCSGRGD